MKRYLAISAAALLAGSSAVVGAAPAFSAASASFTSPGAGETVGASPTIAGSVRLSRTIDSITVTVTRDGASSPSATFGGGCGSAGISCSSTKTEATFSFTADLSTNGTYTATLTAVHNKASAVDSAESVGPVSRTFGVSAPPATPRRVIVDPNAAARSVTVSWQQNTEPDLLGYEVYRGVDGGSSVRVAGVPAGRDRSVAWTDTNATGGTYSYQVRAARWGAGGDVVYSPFSAPATATIDRPATTTTTAPPSTSTTGAGTSTTDGSTGSTGTSSPTMSGLQPVPVTSGPRVLGASQLDMSGYRGAAAGPNLGPAPVPTDPGYNETLPYTPSVPGTAPATTSSSAPGETALAQPVYETTTSTNRKTLLSFLAASMLLFLLSMHLRWLLRRAE